MTAIAQFSPRFPKSEIPDWAERYCSKQGDDAAELLAGDRSKAAGFYTRDDFLIICEWKTRGRPRRHYQRNSEEEVRRQSAIALTSADESTRIWALDVLPGLALRTATALLHFASDPCRPAASGNSYPIIDVRALWSLGCEKYRETFELWWSYVQTCRALAIECRVSMRDLDRALWEYSFETQGGVKCL
jgi:hypothetical protein